MTTRSKLLENVLRAWDQSVEGSEYLGWLIDSDSELDGGDVLREAVLQLIEIEQPPKAAEKALEKFCAQLPPEKAITVREHMAAILAERSQLTLAIRSKVEHLRGIRHLLDCDRIEALKFVVAAQRGNVDGPQDAMKRIAAIEESRAKIAALRRTTAEPVEISGAHSVERTPENQDASEDLDRYYSYQLVNQLEDIVERASALDPIELTVRSKPVKILFKEAHEAYLYGFNVACIALCRWLS